MVGADEGTYKTSPSRIFFHGTREDICTTSGKAVKRDTYQDNSIEDPVDFNKSTLLPVYQEY